MTSTVEVFGRWQTEEYMPPLVVEVCIYHLLPSPLPPLTSLPHYTLSFNLSLTHPSLPQGKVPRNQYGNVEMFKSSMLPVGGAHIKSELWVWQGGVCQLWKWISLNY